MALPSSLPNWQILSVESLISSDILGCGLEGNHTRGNTSPLDYANLVTINNLDVHRSRIDIEIEVAKLVGIKGVHESC